MPTAFADMPMDLSMKSRRKLRLEEFLRQNLDEAPARRVIEWVDRAKGVFRILWTHQSSGAFTHDDAALFRYWALARGEAPMRATGTRKKIVPSGLVAGNAMFLRLNRIDNISMYRIGYTS